MSEFEFKEAKVLHLRANIGSLNLARIIKNTQIQAGMNAHIMARKENRYEVVWHKGDESCKFCEAELTAIMEDGPETMDPGPKTA